VIQTNWMFICVGAGNRNFEEAALRLVAQVAKSGVFVECRSILTKELNELIPELETRIIDEQGSLTQGYGYYSWKSRVAKLALQGKFGEIDGLVMADSGCEFFLSPLSIRRLESYFNLAQTNGVAAFAISTPEYQFTKKSLFRYFPTIKSTENSSQFQSGILIIDGVKGLEIVKKWDEIVWDNLQNVDDSCGVESADFFAHRHDQSVLSLVLKSKGVIPITENPPGVVGGLYQAINAYSYPIWWSRNRTGSSQIPHYLNQVGRFSYRFLHFFRSFSK